MKDLGILFDFNGVLVTDEPQQLAAMAAALTPHGVTLTEELYQQYCLGRTDTVGFTSLKSVFPGQLGDVPVKALVAAKLEYYQGLASASSLLAPNLQSALAALSPIAALGIVSGAPRSEVALILGGAGLTPMFSAIITNEDTTRGKPDPEGYQKGTAVLGLPPERTLAVEDTPHGIAAAQAAGLRCIAVAGTLPADQLQAADAIVSKLADVNPNLVTSLVR